MKQTNVLIGIQARSGSTRLPGKCYAIIGNKRALDHVIDAVSSACFYLNRFSEQKKINIRYAVLIPERDDIKEQFKTRAKFFEGPEYDVLGRYKQASDYYGADYVCRITGDCILIPPYIIAKHITLALTVKYDYIGNSDPECRTSLDGIDCEVFSKRLLDYHDEHSKDPSDREHVTPPMRRGSPKWAKLGTTVGFFDQSDIKLSLDTEADLRAIRQAREQVENKISIAEKKYGKSSVHKF